MDSVPVITRRAVPDDFGRAGDLTVAAYVTAGHLQADDAYVASLRDCARRAAEAELWVAQGERDGEPEVIGTVTYCPVGSPWREIGDSGEGEFRMLAVDPSAQGRGVGRALIGRCIELAELAG
ncbi:MAG: GNAT family N-acetyltransferase, partial [Nocardioides sp.]